MACGQGSAVLSFDVRRRARKELDRLIDEAISELLAAKAGDLDGVYGGHRLAGRAVALLIDHRLGA